MLDKQRTYRTYRNNEFVLKLKTPSCLYNCTCLPVDAECSGPVVLCSALCTLETQTEGICQFVLCIGIRFQLERYTNTGRFRLSFKCSPKTPRLLSSINCRYFTFGIDTPILLLFSLFLFTWGFI